MPPYPSGVKWALILFSMEDSQMLSKPATLVAAAISFTALGALTAGFAIHPDPIMRSAAAQTTSSITLNKPSCAVGGSGTAPGASNGSLGPFGWGAGAALAICIADLDNTGQLQIVVSNCGNNNGAAVPNAAGTQFSNLPYVTKIINANGTVRATIPC